MVDKKGSYGKYAGGRPARRQSDGELPEAAEKPRGERQRTLTPRSLNLLVEGSTPSRLTTTTHFVSIVYGDRPLHSRGQQQTLTSVG
jgi:hypothetical protein